MNNRDSKEVKSGKPILARGKSCILVMMLLSVSLHTARIAAKTFEEVAQERVLLGVYTLFNGHDLIQPHGKILWYDNNDGYTNPQADRLYHSTIEHLNRYNKNSNIICPFAQRLLRLIVYYNSEWLIMGFKELA